MNHNCTRLSWILKSQEAIWYKMLNFWFTADLRGTPGIWYCTSIHFMDLKETSSKKKNKECPWLRQKKAEMSWILVHKLGKNVLGKKHLDKTSQHIQIVGGLPLIMFIINESTKYFHI